LNIQKNEEEEETRTFVLPTKSFDVTIKFPIGQGRYGS
jgi:hypothetical protein